MLKIKLNPHYNKPYKQTLFLENMKKEKTPGVIASKIRKRFNKEYGLSIGDLIKQEKGNISEYRGLSTYSDMSKIIINAYNTHKTSNNIYQIPKERLYDGKKYAIIIKAIDMPEIGVKKEKPKKEDIEKKVDEKPFI